MLLGSHSQGVQELISPGVESLWDWLPYIFSDWPASAVRGIKTADREGKDAFNFWSWPFIYYLDQYPEGLASKGRLNVF